MSMSNRNSRHTPIGIDIRDDEVFGVQFAKSGGQLTLKACARRPIEANDSEESRELAVTAAVESLLKDSQFAGRRAVSALRSEDVDTRPILLPSEACRDEGPEFAKALLMEASSCLLYSPEDAVLNYLFLDRDSQEEQALTEVLLIATQKELVNKHLSMLKRAGAKVLHVDSAACAAVRLLGADKTAQCIIELDSNYCIVSIGYGHDLQFSRTIKIGVNRIIEAVARHLSVDFAEAERMLEHRGIDHEACASYCTDEFDKTGSLNQATITRGLFESCRTALDELAVEVRRSIDYFGGLQSSTTISRAILAGHVLPKGLAEYLQSRLDVPVSIARAFDSCALDERSPVVDEHLFVRAAGLALRDELT